MNTWRILQGDVRQRLAELPSNSVHICVTSPPYWGLRAYGTAPLVWGGLPGCLHEWGETIVRLGPAGKQGATSQRVNRANVEEQTRDAKPEQGAFCRVCGAWRCELGLEPTPDLYVEHIVAVFREVRRVLRNDGSLWLNLGDCYATGAGAVGECPGGGEQGARWRGDVNRLRDEKRGYRGERLVNTNGGTVTRPKTQGYRGVHPAETSGKQGPRIASMGPMTQPNRMPIPGLKPKDRVGIPWRVAFALQADGWYLRQEMPWLKRNGMPESTEDRPTTTVESLFLLTKSEQVYYDVDAVMKVGAIAAGTRAAKGGNKRSALKDVNGRPPEYWDYTGERFRRSSDWFFETFEGLLGDEDGQPIALVANTRPFPEAHFAVFPPALVEPCILAGTSEKGCCAACGAPVVRVVERIASDHDGSKYGERVVAASGGALSGGTEASTLGSSNGTQTGKRVTVRWDPSCDCGAGTVPCLVLDPFAGSGTCGAVAIQQQRDFVGIELNAEYVELARRRIGSVAPLLASEASA